jgi:hypothetical protein
MEAKLCSLAHLLIEDHSGVVVGTYLTRAGGYAEHRAAVVLVEPYSDHPCAIMLEADKAFDTQDFVNGLCDEGHGVFGA